MGNRDSSATVLDVARLAGVSATTVSNVVNGKFSLMTPETRSRVEAAIAELNYRPNTGARSLRHLAKRSVGMIVVDNSPQFLMHPAHAHIVTGLSNGLAVHGYNVLLQGVRPQHLHSALSIQNISTDAICAILSGPTEERLADVDLLRSIGQPIVLFHEKMDRIPDDTLIVRANEFGGAQMLAEHVIERGCRRLTVLVPATEWPANTERVLGFTSAAKRSHLADPDIVYCGDGSFEVTQEAVANYLEKNKLPDAFLATQDQIGIAAVKYLRSRSVVVPQDVMVTGFNAFEFWKYSEPVLTTIRSPAYELGQLAADQIIDRLTRGSFTVQEITASVHFEVGGTTADAPPSASPQSARRKSRKRAASTQPE